MGAWSSFLKSSELQFAAYGQFVLVLLIFTGLTLADILGGDDL